MFTGIIEAVGTVTRVTGTGSTKTFYIASPISAELSADQSVAHNGVCLTVESVHGGEHRVTAVRETLEKSNLDTVQAGDLVNLERCVPLNGRLDGHLVQGHVDATAICIERTENDGSWEFRFRFPVQFAALVIEKGSISLNGISLTVFNVTQNEFTIAIIPYTFQYTNIFRLRENDSVNLEFDLLGKYVLRHFELSQAGI